MSVSYSCPVCDNPLVAHVSNSSFDTQPYIIKRGMEEAPDIIVGTVRRLYRCINRSTEHEVSVEIPYRVEYRRATDELRK